MKTGILCAGFLLALITASCNKIKPDHPQSGIMSSAEINELVIKNYADSVDQLIPELQKEVSLLYTLGDYSFYAVKYIMNAKPVLYIEYGERNDYGNKEQRYYLKNGESVLYSSISESIQTDSAFHAERAFFRNDILFYSEAKKAVTGDELKTTSYSKSETNIVNAKEHLAKLENAINQREEFDLVFEGITEYPKAKYLILSRNEINAYRAPVLIEHDDDFIREISMNPDKYRGRKMLINWKLVNENEVGYVSGSLR